MTSSRIAIRTGDERETAVRPEAVVHRVATPLVVGAVDDRAEHEADRVAHEVITRLQAGDGAGADLQAGGGGGGPGVARVAVPMSGSPEVGRDGGAISEGLTARIEARRGSGHGLDEGVRRSMESGFGRSLGDVRVHTDGEAARLNRSVSARAFTTGQDIFFGAGEYAPDTHEGQHILAHEIAHTQQGGGGARRTAIRRTWNFKASRLPLGKAVDVTALERLPIWFVEDKSGDRLVVKVEDQPVGLAVLAGQLHKSVSGIKSVKIRPLGTTERGALAQVIDVRSRSNGLHGSWATRGKAIKAQAPAGSLDGQGHENIAVDEARNHLLGGEKTVVAMTLAKGEEASKLSVPDDARGDGDAVTSRYQELLRDPHHLAQLGRLAAVDMFYGNSDRLTSGNFGNWFVNMESPERALMLIDHVDPGQGGSGTADMMGDFDRWEVDIGRNMGEDVYEIFEPLLKNMKEDGSVYKWAVAKDADDGTSPIDVMLRHFAPARNATMKRIVKIFSTTRWSLLSPKKHAAKKTIRSSARGGARDDGNAADLYYRELKARADYIKVTFPAI